MRQLGLVGVVAVVACGCGDSAEPVAFPFDVVVSQRLVQIYTNGADLLPCQCEVDRFPQPGACVQISDSKTCTKPDPDAACGSCMEVSVELAGTPISTMVGSDPRSLAFDASADAALSLVMRGCGHEPTSIPLTGVIGTAPSIATQFDQNMAPIVSWTTSQPSASALVAVHAGTQGYACHVIDAMQYTFSTWANVPVDTVDVRTFASSDVVETPFGEARIWRGESASKPIP